eukprot:6506760-Alexandrium_andersonii.AAC.1
MGSATCARAHPTHPPNLDPRPHIHTSAQKRMKQDSVHCPLFYWRRRLTSAMLSMGSANRASLQIALRGLLVNLGRPW